MKLLVFGANSQLGRELVNLLAVNEVDYATLTTMDVDVLKPRDVIKAVSRVNPTQLINVAACSNLQEAESDDDAARRCDLINTEGVVSLAKVCEQLGIPIIHHSSSCVFDGRKKETYVEDDEADPVSRYGKSKWLGERTLREEAVRHIILRTDWLFSELRPEYFLSIIDACKKNKGKVGVIDNRFCPTWAGDAARVIYAVIKQVDCNAEAWGTFHYNAMQPVNQDQFVEQLLEEAATLDKALEKILPSLEVDLLPVELPYIQNSALNCEKIKATFGIKQHQRSPGLKAVLEKLYGVSKGKAPASRSKTAGARRNARKKSGEAAGKKKARPKSRKPAAKSPRRSKQPARKAATRK